MDEYNAGDLKQASALAAIAAGVLYNAHLFEEVVEARNFNENILENLSNGVISLDLSLQVTKTNAAARRILHLSEESHIGSAALDILGPENSWVLDSLVTRSIDSTGIQWTDRDLKLGDGKGATVNISAVPLDNAEGKPIGFMLVIEDITREKTDQGYHGQVHVRAGG